MSAPAGEDLYRSYRALDPSSGGDRDAARFADRYLVPVLLPLRDQPVLEIGAGTGGTLRALRASGFRLVTGVDSSPSQVEAARAQGTAVELADGLVALRARPPRALGAIILLDVLEHLSVPELLDLLDLARDRLQPGGLLVARAPNGEGLFGGAILYGDITHLRAFTQRSVEQVFALRGLETVGVHPIRPMAHGPMSALRVLVWRTTELLLRLAAASETGRGDLVATRNLLAIARRPS